jgi:hypothetical protein
MLSTRMLKRERFLFVPSSFFVSTLVHFDHPEANMPKRASSIKQTLKHCLMSVNRDTDGESIDQ